jgi:ADP-ribosyl-[dinitrogen reductase] hydrolase
MIEFVAARDRAVGAMVGLAVGDALGTTLEFCARDARPPLIDMVGGGPFQLGRGQWTDDTAMSLSLADCLDHDRDFSEQELLSRFVNWWELGINSCTGTCFDIGITTRAALMHWQRTKQDHCGSTDPQTAGNGSLMRLAPVAVRFWNDRPHLRDIAGRQSRTTHAAPESVDACVAFADVLADAIEGQSKDQVLRNRWDTYASGISMIMSGGWRGKVRDQIHATGYVAHSLEAALWCVDRTNGFRDAVLMAANLGDDADTTAAITGQLAGALYGCSDIPKEWLQVLAWRPDIEAKAVSIFDRSVDRAAAE